MSSFRRKASPSPSSAASATASAPIPTARRGSRPFLNGQALVSSGLRDLDALVGGGQLLGSVVLLEAAEPLAAPLVDDLLRYFAGEGVAAGQRTAVVAEDAAAFVALRLPRELSLAQRQVKRQLNTNGNSEDLTIAWQYEKYLKQPASDTNSRFCHSFDLARAMHAEMAAANPPEAIDVCDLPSPTYGAVLARLEPLVAEAAASQDQVLRVCVRELGSPLFGPPTQAHMAALLGFVRRLRALAAGRPVVCQLSGTAGLAAFPPHFLNELRHASDYVLQLSAFAGERDLLPPELCDFHGLLELRKLARVHALAAFAAPATRLGIRRDVRKLRIEKFHLPPEGSRSSSSGDATGSAGRGRAGGKHDPLAF